MKGIIVFLYIILFMPLNVSALHEIVDSRCTNTLKTSLREEANDVVYRLSRVSNDKDVTYTAYFYNLTENIYIYFNDNIIYDNKIENLKPGSNIAVAIYPSNKNYCAGYKAKTLVINVPFYNPYFGTEVCSGFDNFYLCQEHSNVNMSESEFNKKLNEYKESLTFDEKDNENDKDLEENSKKDLLSFVNEYKYYFVGIIVFIVIFIVININKRKKERGIL